MITLFRRDGDEVEMVGTFATVEEALTVAAEKMKNGLGSCCTFFTQMPSYWIAQPRTEW